jgi:riboflavin biosynthesis pyrimidine reductase
VNEIKIFGGTELDFPAILRWLREKWNVRRLLCEGGGQLNEALIRAGLVDEIHATFCPLIFGGRTAPTLAEGRGRLRLAGAARFELTSLSRKNGELFTVFARAKPDR